MTYGQDLGLFIGSGPVFHSAATVAAPRSSSRFAAWRTLDEDRRLALVEQALAGPANDNADGFPVAL